MIGNKDNNTLKMHTIRLEENVLDHEYTYILIDGQCDDLEDGLTQGTYWFRVANLGYFISGDSYREGKFSTDLCDTTFEDHEGGGDGFNYYFGDNEEIRETIVSFAKNIVKPLVISSNEALNEYRFQVETTRKIKIHFKDMKLEMGEGMNSGEFFLYFNGMYRENPNEEWVMQEFRAEISEQDCSDLCFTPFKLNIHMKDVKEIFGWKKMDLGTVINKDDFEKYFNIYLQLAEVDYGLWYDDFYGYPPSSSSMGDHLQLGDAAAGYDQWIASKF